MTYEEALLHETNDYHFRLAGDELAISRSGEEQGRFGLSPSTESIHKLGSWRIEEGRRVAAAEGLHAQVAVGVEHGHFFYELQGNSGHYSALTYFAESTMAASRWQTFVFNGNDGQWVIDQDKEVGVTSASVVLGEVYASWYPNLAPHVAAFQMNDGSWLGLSMPAPLPVAESRFQYIGRRFSLRFEHVVACDEGPLPRVYFIPGLGSPEEALEVHASLAKAHGYWRERKEHPSWWSLPVWGIFDENCWAGQSGADSPPAETSGLSPVMVKSWVSRVQEISGCEEFFVMAEQGYFSRYGDFEAVDSMGKTEGMRALVDELREQKKRVGLYFHPFFVDRRIPEIEAHPEWLVRGDTSVPAVPIANEMQLALLDWTHPDARAYMLSRVRYLLSSEPGCLDIDWLCVHNNHVPDPRLWQFHDPQWGVGDLMKFKVMREIYDTAKAVKAECLVRWIIAESWAQPFHDRNYINEDWSDTCDNWFRMARIVTRTLPGTLVDACPWFLSRAEAREFFMVMPAFGIASNTPLSQFRVGRRGDWEAGQPEDYRRWKASWQVYGNAPMTADQDRQLDYHDGRVFAWRKYTTGPLKGFYAARTFSRRCFATYNEHQALLTATEDLTVDLPLPPGACLQRVEAVLHDGSMRSMNMLECSLENEPALRIDVEDSGGEVLYYRIVYGLS